MSKYVRPRLKSSPKPGLSITAFYIGLCVLVLCLGLVGAVCFSTSFLAYKPAAPVSTVFPIQPAWPRIQDLSRKQQRYCLVLFGTDFCHPCSELESRLSHSEEVQQLIKSQFVPYKIDAFSRETGGVELAERYDVYSLPSMLVTDAEGKELYRFSGVFEVGEILRYLKKLPPYGSLPDSSQATPAIQYLQGKGISRLTDLYALKVAELYDYGSARMLALEHSHIWDKGIWIHHSSNGQYELLLGAFDSEYKARVTARLLRAWDQIETQIVPLQADWELY